MKRGLKAGDFLVLAGGVLHYKFYFAGFLEEVSEHDGLEVEVGGVGAALGLVLGEPGLLLLVPFIDYELGRARVGASKGHK